MAQNEMKAKPALPERVRSMEGLGVILEPPDVLDECAKGYRCEAAQQEWCSLENQHVKKQERCCTNTYLFEHRRS